MIDWLTFVAVLQHEPGELGNGRVMAIDANGVIEWESQRWLHVAGSYEARIGIRSTTTITPTNWQTSAVEVSGNPAKFLQGHNLFGCDDVHGLAVATLEKLAALLRIAPSESDRAAWSRGDMHVTRVDVTQSFATGSRARARNALRAMERYARMAHRGRGALIGKTTLIFGQKSRRWGVKWYVKGDELEAGKAHRLPVDIERRDELAAWADDKLRCELVVRAMQLKEWGLDTISAWKPTTAALLSQFAMSKTNVAEGAMIAPDVLEMLAPRLQAAYQLWRDGHDLRELFTRATFYRYRAELLRHGIDVALRLKADEERSNVIPLRLVLHARPADVPEWAQSGPLYFDPQRKVG